METAFINRSDWLTANEAAEYLKVKKRTLLLWTRQGKIPAFAVAIQQNSYPEAKE